MKQLQPESMTRKNNIFLKNPSLAFGKDFEAIKIYITKEFDVNTFKIPGGEKAYIEL